VDFEEAVASIAASRGCAVVRKLGCGGMGCVYLVRDESTHEERALKVMVPHAALDDGARKLFVREIRNASALDHPNVVRATDAGVMDSMLFLEMEFCAGGSADTLMKETGRVSVDRAWVPRTRPPRSTRKRMP
jgi:eukaryotic-like serine/threonine-protein kinase